MFDVPSTAPYLCDGTASSACMGHVYDTSSRDSWAHITKNIFDATADFDTGERPEEIRGGGVKYLWKDALGDFREGQFVPLKSLSDQKVVIDVSSWVHKLDGIHEVAYARTSTPVYCHPALIYSFRAKNETLKKLGMEPIFVFDGMSPNMKKKENMKRQKKSTAAGEKYHKRMQQIKQRIEIGGEPVSDGERQELLKLRREKSRPQPEEYATLCQWMDDNGIKYVQSPFEADSQMKQLIDEGAATAAITEDGDLVVLGVPHILSKTALLHKNPEKSTCQYFDSDKLRSGEYESPISVSNRIDFLPEIAAILGCDYYEGLSGIGPGRLFAIGKKLEGKEAVIDSYAQKTTTDEEWIEQCERKYRRGKPKSDDEAMTDETAWSASKFMHCKNLLRHYPVFKRDESGNITLKPLNPLPDDVSESDWGAYIGFDKNPSEYFEDGSYDQYYNMTIVGSTGKPREDHLGPRFSAEDHPDADESELLPTFAKIIFAPANPIDVQPRVALAGYLLSRGVPTTEADTNEAIREWVYRAEEEGKQLLPPSLIPQPAKWVGFEPLEELELGDAYDDWVSVICVSFHTLKLFPAFSHNPLLCCKRITTTPASLGL